MGVTEYLGHARECAKIAETLQGEDKKKLLQIAEAWLQVASEAAELTQQSRRSGPPRAA